VAKISQPYKTSTGELKAGGGLKAGVHMKIMLKIEFWMLR